MGCQVLKTLEYQILNKLIKLKEEFQLSLSFLSRLPFGKLSNPIPSISNACWAFPLCGIIIGSFIYLTFWFLIYIKVPLFIAVILSLALGIFVTGGIHEDGLADSCDGIFGGKNIKSKLSIMTDSNVGTYGALSLIIIFSLRVFILSEFEVNLTGFISFISISATSRLSMLFILLYLPPAKKNGLGFNAIIKNYRSIVIPCIISFLLLALNSFLGIYILLSMCLALLIIMYVSWKSIKGQTGDICGASQQLTETVGWFTFVYLY